MKNLLNKFAVVTTLALASAIGAQAQNTTTIEYGRTIMQFDPNFTGGLASLGVQLGGVGFSSVDQSGVIVFPVVGGAVDLQSSKGEVNHLGGISANANGIQVRLQNFVIDTTGAPQVTALLVVNNTLVGRISLFNLTPPANLSLPLPTTVGVMQINGFGVTMSAGGAAALNAVYQTNALSPGMSVGTMNLYAVLSPNSAS